MSVKRILASAILILVSVAGLSALEWSWWSLDIAMTYQVNSQIGTGSDNKEPGKLMFNPGASFFGDWDAQDGGLFFRPGFWLSWGIEEVYEGIARPCDEAEISHMKVLGLMADLPFGWVFQTGAVDIGVQGGGALYLRFPLYTAQEGTGEPSDYWAAYYGGAQFLYLSLASWVGFPVSENMDFNAGLRYYQPLSNLWTEAPFAHGIQISLMASVTFRLEDTP